MKRNLVPLLVVGLAAVLGTPLHGQGPAEKKPTPELNAARQTGWQLALVIVERLEGGDLQQFPGIQAWLKDFRKASKGIDLKTSPEKWPALDMDALVSRNPNFWRAYYEIAPGDPGLMLLHAGLLLSAGEATRATYLIVIAEQRPGVPKSMGPSLGTLLNYAQQVVKKPNFVISQGIQLHDQGDFAGAIKKYQEALSLWPQNGLAHYELGLSRYCQDLIAAGEKVPAPNTVQVDSGRKLSAAVKTAFAQARRHDPFQVNAYQGDDKEVLRGLIALVKVGLPAWQKVLKHRTDPVEDPVLQKLAEGCQEANSHELALAVRQVLVAHRGRYDSTDHPFIAASLRQLVPGSQTDELLKRLARGKISVRQLVPPDVLLRQFRLYVSNEDLPKRIGKDVNPLVTYIKELEKATVKCLEREELPKAKGLLVAVGVKPDKKTRVWCQSVEGEIPPALLRKLETDLARVEGLTVKNGVLAFALEMQVRGQQVGQYPEFPAVWVDAAKKHKKKLVPPDELFKVIWAN